MSAASVGFDGSGDDGGFAWWEPSPKKVFDLRDALNHVNLCQLLPKASTIPAALKETLSGFIEAANLRVRGLPIVINPLSNDVKGVEAVQRHPGAAQNQFTHIMSIVLDDATGQVKIASHNPSFFAMPNQWAVENRMTSVFLQQLNWYPTPMVSSCLSRVIAHLGGVLCRKTGGVYYLPESALASFEPLATLLESGEGDLAITITKFTLNPGERSYRLVAQSIRREVEEVLVQVEEGLKTIGRQRQNGRDSRTELLSQLAEKVSRYEGILGIAMSDLTSAIGKVQEAVDAHSAVEDLSL
jgi:hypothetical protein